MRKTKFNISLLVIIGCVILSVSCASAPYREDIKKGSFSTEDLAALEKMNQSKLDRDGFAPIHYVAMSGYFRYFIAFVKDTHANIQMKAGNGKTAAEIFLDTCSRRYSSFSAASGNLLMAILGGEPGAVEDLVEESEKSKEYFLNAGVCEQSGSIKVIYPYNHLIETNSVSGAHESPLFYALYLDNDDAAAYIMSHLPPSKMDVAIKKDAIYREGLEQCIISLLEERRFSEVPSLQVINKLYEDYPSERDNITRAVFEHLDIAFNDALKAIASGADSYQAQDILLNYSLFDDFIYPKIQAGEMTVPIEFVILFGNPGMNNSSQILVTLRRYNYIHVSDAVIDYFREAYLDWEKNS
jgi:hypothetical protein